MTPQQKMTPCWGCGDREPGCHGKCAAYHAYRTLLDAAAAQRLRKNEILCGTPAMDAAKKDARRTRPSAPRE